MPRTLVLDGPRQLRLSEQPSRPLRPGEIRLRARLSGISHGTELSLYRGTSAFTDKVFGRACVRSSRPMPVVPPPIR
jgi:threonine dehydrogenase-like Zn-dependent dehydrogenase